MKKIKMESSGKMRTVPISELLEQRIEFQTITNNTPLLAFTIAEGVNQSRRQEKSINAIS